MSLRSDWLALWKRSSTATPFQSPDWVIPWWEHFGTGRLCVLALMKAGELLGLAPLFVNGEEQSSLRFVGTGNTDYLDVLLDDSASHDSVPALFNYICETRSWLARTRPVRVPILFRLGLAWNQGLTVRQR